MKLITKFCILFLCLNPSLFAQKIPNSNPRITVQFTGMKNFVPANNDTIFIKELQNTISVELPYATDSLQFRLVGLESKIQTSAYPSIRYTNLEGGKYTLLYKQKNQANFSKIHIHIQETIWQKWWFFPMILFYVFLLVGIAIYFLSLHNLRQKMKVQLMRNKISADLHDEVGSNLSSIAIYTQVLRKSLTDKTLLPLLDKISNNSRESVQLMQDTVWSLNPANDNVERVLERINTYGKGVLSEQNIGYSQHIKADMSKLGLDMEDRKNLYLILKESINNIAKHAKASKASLQVKEDRSKIVFLLSDNGVGFEMTQNTEGNGLRNLKERADESGFEFEINSQKGQGTQILLTISP